MINCPSCGAALTLRSAAQVYSTCSYCQSLVLHSALGVEDLGKVAVLPFDMSPIRLGTRLRVEQDRFHVVGRVRWGWSGGAWNEWLLEAGDGSPAWLAEAMGMFLFTRECHALGDDPVVVTFASGREPQPGQAILLDGTLLRATDIKSAQCLGSEGDLPFATLPGTELVNVDFRSRTGAALSLQRQGESVSAWYGHFCELVDLEPEGLREIEGWPLPEALR